MVVSTGYDFLSEEKQEAGSYHSEEEEEEEEDELGEEEEADEEALDDDDDDDDDESEEEAEAEVKEEEEDGDEFSDYIDNLPNEIETQEDNDEEEVYNPRPTKSRRTPQKEGAKLDPPIANNDDNGAGKPAAKAIQPTDLKNPRTQLDPDKDGTWMASLEKMKEFKRINGHTNVPYLQQGGLMQIMTWCFAQRRYYRTGKLQPARIAALEAIGFEWTPTKGRFKKRHSWEERLSQLQAHHETYKTWDVEKDTLVETEMQLRQWAFVQREKYHQAGLSADKVQQLDAIGFDWGPDHLFEAENNKKRPATTPTAPPPAKRTKPNTANTGDALWEQRYEELQAYKAKTGTCLVPCTYAANQKLANWVSNQRQFYRRKKLRKDRQEKLQELGFAWSNSTSGATNTPPPAKAPPPPAKAPPPPPALPLPEDEDEWVEMLQNLKKLKRKNKNKFPTTFPEEKALERWVRHQKQLLRKKDLHPSRLERLHKLGLELPPGMTVESYAKEKAPAPEKSLKDLYQKKSVAPTKSPLLQHPTKKATASPGAQQPLKNTTTLTPMAAAQKPAPGKNATPLAPIFPAPPMPPPGMPPPGMFPPGMFPFPPGAVPPGAKAPPPGAYPWQQFMPHFPYGPPPPGMMPPGGAAAAAAAAAKQKPGDKNKTPATIVAEAEKAALQGLQGENVKLRKENEQLQALTRSMMTSLEEEKEVRRQGQKELQAKIQTQEQEITSQRNTLQLQEQQMQELMNQMKDVISRQQEQRRIQEEQKQQQEEEEVRQAELQRQREMQELQRQQEAQERQREQQRRRQEQEQQQRQQELLMLRQHGLF